MAEVTGQVQAGMAEINGIMDGVGIRVGRAAAIGSTDGAEIRTGVATTTGMAVETSASTTAGPLIMRRRRPTTIRRRIIRRLFMRSLFIRRLPTMTMHRHRCLMDHPHWVSSWTSPSSSGPASAWSSLSGRHQTRFSWRVNPPPRPKLSHQIHEHAVQQRQRRRVCPTSAARRRETMTKSAIWWKRAHEYRSLAQDTQSPSRHLSYMNIAENCARVARRIEELEGGSSATHRLQSRRMWARRRAPAEPG